MSLQLLNSFSAGERCLGFTNEEKTHYKKKIMLDFIQELDHLKSEFFRTIDLRILDISIQPLDHLVKYRVIEG